MKVLVINCGSSSLKYQLIDMEGEQVLAKGLVERIGIAGSLLTHRTNGQKTEIQQAIPDHKVAIQLVIDALLSPQYGVLKNLSEISAVGHRVVHGGEKFARSVVVDAAVMAALRECSELAPLHNPANIIGIEACRALLPDAPQVAVFDTAFHQTMPREAYMYGLPYEYYQKYGLRRYGFHGTSHKYVSRRAAKLLGRPLSELKLVTCHLGNGSSITAVQGGVSVDTSLGFGTISGTIMGTRCGDVDPAIIPFLMEKENLTPAAMNDVLYKKSGLLGLSGVSSDARDIEAAAAEGNERAELALSVLAYLTRKYIGAYAAAMGGLDAIVFTAGIGENSITIRERVCAGLEFLGAKLDREKNKVRGQEVDVAVAGAKVRILVVPTNEELMIAQETAELVG
ncbi:MAG TPA: acetate kinase [Firmicutes bacterium]|uniref:acetate/propionate family kinase n=1 Tax=Gelria sp. Kuro-4 TaxID=2796927 RepID=UPI001990C43C|nr:acetate kinase [Gelria sp. Kuro-4]BCV24779.1 acetate kinase [Gelria sp. Kuro-4]HHV57079.1 acetate kinase [Bacillota bacterium]